MAKNYLTTTAIKQIPSSQGKELFERVINKIDAYEFTDKSGNIKAVATLCRRRDAYIALAKLTDVFEHNPDVDDLFRSLMTIEPIVDSKSATANHASLSA